MEFTYLILGIGIIYSTIHTFVVLFKYSKKATTYEKVISVIGVVSITLVFLSIMFKQ